MPFGSAGRCPCSAKAKFNCFFVRAIPSIYRPRPTTLVWSFPAESRQRSGYKIKKCTAASHLRDPASSLHSSGVCAFSFRASGLAPAVSNAFTARCQPTTPPPPPPRGITSQSKSQMNTDETTKAAGYILAAERSGFHTAIRPRDPSSNPSGCLFSCLVRNRECRLRGGVGFGIAQQCYIASLCQLDSLALAAEAALGDAVGPCDGTSTSTLRSWKASDRFDGLWGAFCFCKRSCFATGTQARNSPRWHKHDGSAEPLIALQITR